MLVIYLIMILTDNIIGVQLTFPYLNCLVPVFLPIETLHQRHISCINLFPNMQDIYIHFEKMCRKHNCYIVNLISYIILLYNKIIVFQIKGDFIIKRKNHV